ncbi:MAG: HAMP domain-containing histidine kinase, partial [Candidatus Sericytochromatia bacterium]|nr:HAMP domain-containing histidine kinase [Candidatus Tanganyikabacteria bacterium]
EAGRLEVLATLRQSEAQLRTQYEKLKEVDALKTNFVNAVSHDLRTPLTAIVGYSEFLEDELGGPLSAAQATYVEHIIRGARRLGLLGDDLLDFARIEAGTFRLVSAETDLAPTIAEVVASLAPVAQEAEVATEVQIGSEVLVANADSRRVGQVVTNLVHNGIKFTKPEGTVRVRAAYDGPDVLLEVEDSGIGIAAEDLPRPFQRFGQLTAGPPKGGTGLGLSICKAIVEAHGGQIGVRSAIGQGSSFWVRIPRQAADSAEMAQAPEPILIRERPTASKGVLCPLAAVYLAALEQVGPGVAEALDQDTRLGPPAHAARSPSIRGSVPRHTRFGPPGPCAPGSSPRS